MVSLGAAGFALSVIDLLLGAPDLAITQVVVEVIAVVLLDPRCGHAGGHHPGRCRATPCGRAWCFSPAACWWPWRSLPSAGRTRYPSSAGRSLAQRQATPPPVSADYLAKAADETGSANSVMAVLLDYRAYDTLGGEATVIFASILGVYAILRHVGRRRERSAT